MAKSEKKQYLGTGRRKTSVARVFLKSGKGDIVIRTDNNKSYDIKSFFGGETRWESIARGPLDLLGISSQFDVYATVSGGVITGQSEAISMGIARALDSFEQEKLTAEKINFEEDHDARVWHKALRKAGFLTRDSRAVLRKLYGLVKSRKRKQFSKR